MISGFRCLIGSRLEPVGTLPFGNDIAIKRLITRPIVIAGIPKVDDVEPGENKARL